MFVSIFLFILTYTVDLCSYDMFYRATPTYQHQVIPIKQPMRLVDTRCDTMYRPHVDVTPVKKSIDHGNTWRPLDDYHYKAKLVDQDLSTVPSTRATVQPPYNDMIPAPTITQEQVATSLPQAAQVAPEVITYARPIISISREFPIIEQQKLIAQQPGDHHIRYPEDIRGRDVNFEWLHQKSFNFNQLEAWCKHVAYVRSSPEAQAFIAHIDKLFVECNALFNNARSMRDYQAAYGALCRIEAAITQIERIEPLSQVLAYPVYHAVKHMQSPLLDLFLGDKQALTKTDVSQMAWALHGYYKAMEQICDCSVAFPQGQFKQIIDSYYNKPMFVRAVKSIAHYGVKGYRDLTIEKKCQRYHQMLEQQQTCLKQIGAIQTHGLPTLWQEWYAHRQQAAEQALTEKRFYSQTYHLHQTVHTELAKMGLDPQVFTSLRGNALQHILQTEFVKAANMAMGNTHALSQAALHFAHTGASYNQAGHTAQAWTVADICYTIADHVKAIGEGSFEATANVWDMVMHPIAFTENLATNVGQACYNLLSYHLYCLDIEARLRSGDESAIMEAVVLSVHSDRIKQTIAHALTECSTRDILKQATKACLEYKLTVKLLQSFSTLLAGVQKTIETPLLPAAHTLNLEAARVIYEVTFDPATKTYVIDTVQQVCSSAREFKQITPATFASQIADQAGQQVQKIVSVCKDTSSDISASQKLGSFKASVQECQKCYQEFQEAHNMINYEKFKKDLAIEEVTSVVKVTKHGLERLLERGFQSSEIIDLKNFPDSIKYQKNGGVMLIKQVGDKFNVLVEGNNGIITSLRHIEFNKLQKLIRNYCE